MTDTITIKLTRAQQAAAKRLAKLEQWDRNPYYTKPNPYDSTSREPSGDEHTLAEAVLRGIRKAGAK